MTVNYQLRYMEERNKREVAEFKLAELKKLLKPAFSWPSHWKLTTAEGRALEFMCNRQVATVVQLTHVMCNDPDALQDPDNRVKVSISYMRRKLKPFGIVIHTVHGVGFQLGRKSKSRLIAVREAVKNG